MVKKLLLLLLVSFLVSCSNSDKDKEGPAFIGGEIVNPKGKNIVIFKDDIALDTLTLSEDNTFGYTIEDPSAGLYAFQHNEFQMFYLEPGDSLMLRLNTIDFDESLHYSGIGAKENNYLMELFLQNEKDMQGLGAFYLLTPAEFQKKLDSLDKRKSEKYKEFISKNNPSARFKRIAESNHAYTNYIKKELYTSVFNKNPERIAKEPFPKKFYDYRSEIDLGNSELRTYYPYYRLLDVYFDNLTYPTYVDSEDADRKSFQHNYNKVQLIDSLVTNDSLKEKLIVRNVRRYLLNAKDPENEKEMVAFFKEHSTDPDILKDIEALADATIKLTPGQIVPNVLLVKADNTSKNLHSIITKPSVLYFWSLESVKHFKDIHSKAAELSSKYPEYHFIGINTDTHFKKWRKAVKASGYKESCEFQFEDIKSAEKTLVLNSHNKAMIVSKDKKILESNTNLFDSKIEAQLLGFLNQ
ncbi:MAG: hypothetical protein CMC13_00860 [Flavobacteriaceae bacterium]|nr:hypothetical protein [Flavobacteriaceae bacterium]|tara:strand:- start:2491 stop:3894 length:1404 start_codon:yes stop_codon:yes gene_type:complete